MFQLILTITMADLFKRQMPIFSIAFVVAELLYKFHSFALECAAFLVTWFVLDATVQVVLHLKATVRPR